MEAAIGDEPTIESGGPTSILSESRKVQYGDAFDVWGRYVFLRYLEDVANAVLLSDLAYNNINYSRSSATEEQVKLATDLRQHRRGFPVRLGVEPGIVAKRLSGGDKQCVSIPQDNSVLESVTYGDKNIWSVGLELPDAATGGGFPYVYKRLLLKKVPEPPMIFSAMYNTVLEHMYHHP
ncbi:MAG: hypothetical protein J3Q66DRAFT_406972 [Benniella sp.]|nr:MAG: hypothetical protein J3Q66DRAFT_406972 [Benniella sp.]